MADGSVKELTPSSSRFDTCFFYVIEEIEIMVNPSGLTCYDEHGVSSLHPHPPSDASVLKLPLKANTPGASDVLADTDSRNFAVIGYSPQVCSTGKFEVRNERPSSILPLVGEDLCENNETVEVRRINSHNNINFYLLGGDLTDPIDVPDVRDSAGGLIMVSEKCDFLCLIIV